MSSRRVAGLVLNFNGREVTLETLASLEKSEYPYFDVLHIDNGSSDGSFEAVCERFPHLRQLRIGTNRGISWGLDHGIQVAVDEGYDYLLLMNNDIEVAPSMVGELVAAAEADRSIGCVGPKAYYWSDKQRLWSAGGVLRYRESITRERGDGEIDRGQYDVAREVSYVNGCAMLVRREVFERIGVWDPSYYLGLEDADFCVRAKRAGFRCWYAPTARLWHRISHSIGVYKPTRTFHTGRSHAIFLRKFATPSQWVASLLWLTAAIPVAFLRELPRGNQRAALEKARGFAVGLRAPIVPIPQRFCDLV